MNTGFTLAIAAAVAWGLVYVLSERVLRDFSPLALLFIYGVLTSVVLAPFILTGHIDAGDFFQRDRTALYLTLTAVLLTVLANFLILMSIERLGATPAALIEISYPLFTVIFVFLLFGTVPSWATAAGGVLIITGAAIITKFA
ncbi:MAG TPA: DMT family transporter [Candidatus Paceibacterota bacterium]|nr:DMT family transporter [Candidatus Paceibacterota bacterium]